MFRPRNGSLLANAMLVALGAAVGVAGTWLFGPTRVQERIVFQNVPAAPAKAVATTDKAEVLANPNDPESRAVAWRAKGGQAGDPTQALKEAEGIASEQDRLDYLRGFYGEWARRNPQAAADHARAVWKSGSAQTESVGSVIGQWAEADPRSAWKWSEENLSGPMKEQTLTSLLQGWTRRSPAEAAGWLADSGLTTQAYFDAVGAAWAARSPREAADWASAIDDSASRKSAENAVASEWARNDPAEAANHFAQEIVKADAPNIDLATTIADIWGTTDPAATAKWVGQLPAGPGHEEAASTLATVWAASDIQAAVQWSQSLSDSETRERVIEHLGTTWGAIEPDRALDWLATLPPQEAADGIEGAVHSWAGTDPVGLREWIDQSQPSNLTDQARLSLGDVLTDTDLPSAMDLALGIADPARRDVALTRFFQAWRKTDPEGAQEWFNSQGGKLPARLREGKR